MTPPQPADPAQPSDPEYSASPDGGADAGLEFGVGEGRFLLNMLSPKSREALQNLAELEQDAALRAFLSSSNSLTRLAAIGFSETAMLRLSDLVTIPIQDQHSSPPDDLIERLDKDPPLALLVYVGENAAEIHLFMEELREENRGAPLSIVAFVDSAMVAMSALPHSWTDAVIPLDLSKDVLKGHLERLFDIFLTQKDLTTVFLAHSVSQSQFRKAAYMDSLTGVMNFVGFQDVAARELSRVRRVGQPLGLIMIDIDHFKKINDTFGHPQGNAVLKQLAPIIRTQTRDLDAHFRLGGEEFGILLPRTSFENLAVVAERVRKAVESAHFTGMPSAGAVKVSMGALGVEPQKSRRPKDWNAMYSAADELLYLAKGQGRNRVAARLYEPPPA
ncbi:MAG: GGDEF domain-containing protein [Nitrospinota bacterium]|nr:GGDEF domain-containing protein [Nitrospinota bacterium]MDP7664697.1 GGDEF domain-containing protein [Nitrospinota bacterium]